MAISDMKRQEVIRYNFHESDGSYNFNYIVPNLAQNL